jgi:hypothetical protein
MSEAQCEMPKYQCHKKVWALKIKDISVSGNQWLLSFEEKDYSPIQVTCGWRDKHNPQAGGYYVVYEDGYKSFSPADSFESGYTRITRI